MAQWPTVINNGQPIPGHQDIARFMISIVCKLCYSTCESLWSM
nr:MAG TPA: hypothetical protein [Caudoviricetes sp.]